LFVTNGLSQVDNSLKTIKINLSLVGLKLKDDTVGEAVFSIFTPYTSTTTAANTAIKHLANTKRSLVINVHCTVRINNYGSSFSAKQSSY